jgi:hypothetical protein
MRAATRSIRSTRCEGGEKRISIVLWMIAVGRRRTRESRLEAAVAGWVGAEVEWDVLLLR